MQKKKSLNDNKSVLAILIQDAPVLGVGFLMMTLGFRLASFIPSAGRSVIQLVFWILFVVLLLMANEPFWNFLIFLFFSLGAGLILYWLSAGRLDPKTWFLVPVLFFISAAGGELIQGSSRWINVALITGTLLFICGWVGLQFFPAINQIRIIWIFFGLALFSASIIVIFSRGKDQKNGDCGISRSIQLSVALFNLCWLVNML